MRVERRDVKGTPTLLCGGRPFYEHDTCRVCGAPTTVLCDWILKKGTIGLPTPVRCHKPLCDAHALQVDENKHLCGPHRADWALHSQNPKQRQETNEDATERSGAT